MRILATLILTLLALGAVAQTTTQPERFLRRGFTQFDSARANIVVGVSHEFSAVPTGATAAVEVSDVTWTVRWIVGDRITVNDATKFYIHDGTEFVPLITEAAFSGLSSSSWVFDEIIGSTTDGKIDGTNKTFQTSNEVSGDLIEVWLSYDGDLFSVLREGAHFTLSGTGTIETSEAPYASDPNRPYSAWSSELRAVYAK